MRAYDIIAAKRDGKELTEQEIRFLIQGFTEGKVPDYQMSAWLMAVYLKGLTAKETSFLTASMVKSGEVLDLSSIPGVKVDKHSTGGVGDKTTFVLVPLLAAAGLKVAKMSGRGLGHTGGTVDKLGSIPGMRVNLPIPELIEQVRKVGTALVGQSSDLVPADKKLYALRDVTATVESIPLIASSVMSKKLAAGADVILIDVKVGSGAFMKDISRARELAQLMVQIGRNAGRKVVCVITDMDQPLGKAVGNSLEVIEAIQTLAGHGPEDLVDLCIRLAGLLIHSSGYASTVEDAEKTASKILESGTGLAKLRELVNAQGGDIRAIDDFSLFPKAEVVLEIPSPAEGYVAKVDAYGIGRAAMAAGAGRVTKEDKIDLAAGIILNKKIGEYVRKGELIACVHCGRGTDPETAVGIVNDSCSISAAEPEKTSPIYEVIVSGD